MEEKLIKRLSSLGYTYESETDEWMLNFLTESVEKRILNTINDTVIPEGLTNIEIDMICGEFLKSKKATNQLTTFDFESAIQSIKEGDTSVTFQSGLSPEQQFYAYISSLANGNEEDFIRYRKLVW
jgi:hypothetical protein